MWWWILIWLLLLLAAAAVLGLLVWFALVRPGIRLGRTMGDCAERVSTALEPLEVAYRPDPSVLVDPSAMPAAPEPSARHRRR